MTPQEFIDTYFTEKQAAPPNLFGRLFNAGAKNMAGDAAQAASRAATKVDAVDPHIHRFAGPSLTQRAVNTGMNAGQTALDAGKGFGRRALDTARNAYEDAYTSPTTLQAIRAPFAHAGQFLAGETGRIGKFTANTSRRGLNKLDDMYHGRGVANGATDQFVRTNADAIRPGGRWGDKYIGRSQLAAPGIANEMSRVPGMGGLKGMGAANPLNPFNVGVGAGTLAAGYKGTQALLGGGSEPTSANIDNQQIANQAMQLQHGEANPNAAANNGGLMGMWNSLPTEARYAIGAGVPLALAGAYMGSRGNTAAGLGMGALGLGAAGLGAAGAGMFGDGARRMVGQGANALYSGFGGGGDPRSQLGALSQLSPQFGGTMLMGRDPNMSGAQSEQMHNFLTHNRGIIEQLMPQLQNASTTSVKSGTAQAFGEKIGRCWAGYEPVPGKKPYSNDSCRPTGSKKKKDKKEKKAVSSTPRGKTEMTMAPSSRGNEKKINDQQESTNSPRPEATDGQPQKAAAVPFMAATTTPPSVAVWGGTLPKPQPKPKHTAKPQIPQGVSARGAAPAQGPVSLPNRQTARSSGGM